MEEYQILKLKKILYEILLNVSHISISLFFLFINPLHYIQKCTYLQSRSVEEVVSARTSIDNREDDLTIIEGLQCGVFLTTDNFIRSSEGWHWLIGHIEVGQTVTGEVGPWCPG